MLLPKHFSIFQKKNKCNWHRFSRAWRKGGIQKYVVSVRYVIANAFFNFPKKQVQLAQIYGGKGAIRKYFIPEKVGKKLEEPTRDNVATKSFIFDLLSFIVAFARNGKIKD